MNFLKINITRFYVIFLFLSIISNSLYCQQLILAAYDKGEISEYDAESLITLFPAKYKSMQSDEAKLKKMLAKDVAFDKIIAKKADTKNISLRPDYDKAIKIMVKDMTYKMFLEDYAAKNFTVSDEEIITTYNNQKAVNENNFNFNISSIFKNTKDCKTDEEKASAKKEMEDIYKQLKKGADFVEMAGKYSDAVVQYPGQSISLKKGSLEPDIEKKVLALKIGEYTDVVERKDGYYIIRLDNLFEANTPPYEEVKKYIKPQLLVEKVKKSLPEIISKIEKDFKITKIENFPNLSIDVLNTTKVIYKIDDFEMKANELGIDIKKIEQNPKQMEQLKKNFPKFLEKSYNINLIMQKAKKDKFDQTEQYKAKYSVLMNHFICAEYMDKTIKLTADDITDKEADKYIEENKANYTEPAMYEARELVYKTEIPERTVSKDLQKEIDKGKEYGNDLIKKAKAGESFEALVKKYSIAENAADGGYIGWLNSKTVGRIYDWAIQSVKDGYSEPIYDIIKKEFTILKIENSKPSKPMAKEIAYKKAKEFLMIVKQNKLREDFVEKTLKDNNYKYKGENKKKEK